MEQMYQENKDIAEFYIVYISEAHAMDDKRPVAYAKEMKIKEHTTYGERCAVAEMLVRDKKLTIPCLIDGIENTVAKAYKALPDRIFVVGTDGKLVVAGKRGPFGFKPALEETKKWIAAYRESLGQPTTSSSY